MRFWLRNGGMILLWGGILTLLSCGEKTPQASTAQVQQTTDSDEIRFVDLDGKSIDWDSYSGKPVFLNLWATWCKPCIAEMPSIERAWQQLGPEGMSFLVASDEPLNKIRAFQQQNDYTFPIVQIASGFQSLEIYALPTTILYDKAGEKVMSKTGGRVWDDPKQLERMRALLNSPVSNP